MHPVALSSRGSRAVVAGPLTITVEADGLPPAFLDRVRDELALQCDARYGRAAATLRALQERIDAVVPAALRDAAIRHFAERDVDELAAMLPGSVEHEVERTADTLAGIVPSSARPLVCATRASRLAMVQTRGVMAALALAGTPSTVLELTTRGDAVQDRAIAAIGSDNVFVTELEQALRERRADYAVHSCKDLPSALPADMTLAAITRREDPRDAFCSERYASFAELPAGARVGTSSPRRRAQLRALRDDLVYADVRGNVDTRLRKLREGQFDAIVLACAGLDRLAMRATFTAPFGVDEVTPAVGQGALGIETRAGDPLGAHLDAILGDPAITLAVRAERAFLRTLHGGCQAPIGGHAVWVSGRLRLTGAIAAARGAAVLRASREAEIALGETSAAEALGAALAEELLAAGGADLLAAGPLDGRLFLLPQSAGEGTGRIASALREAGAEVVEAADSAAARAALGERLPSAILLPSAGSVRTIEGYLSGLPGGGRRPAVAATGGSSSAAAERGWPPDVVAPEADAGAFVQSVTRYVLENGA